MVQDLILGNPATHMLTLVYDALCIICACSPLKLLLPVM